MVFGIGIIFVLEPPPSEMLSIPGVGESACVIQQIVTGGTADRHGLLQKGDVILSVGQKSASHLTKEAIGNFLRGPSGSTVRLEWAKPDGRTGELELARGNAGYWSLKDENDRLKLELRDQVDKTLRQGLYWLKARSWGASKCAIRHLGPTMTASEVVPFTLVFLFFCAGNFILAQNSCWCPRVCLPLSLLVIHTLSLAQCPELIVVSHRQGKPRRETSNPT
jgi:hypothetical protein